MSFYQLTPEISQKLRKANLTAAEWRFWAYLTELDPWGDRYLDIDPLTVMAECDMSKPTYYRAKAKFQELGLFDFQEEKVSFRNLTGVSKKRQQSQKRDSSLKNDTDSLKNDTDSLKNETTVSKMRQQSQKRENQSPEPLPDKDSDSSHTLQTYKDFKDSLTLSERENFENFCRNETAGFPRPIANLPDYLGSSDSSGQPRYLDFWQRFEQSSAGVQARSHRATQELTQQVYEEMEGELIDDGWDMYVFSNRAVRNSPEWHLRGKFLDLWEQKNPNFIASEAR